MWCGSRSTDSGASSTPSPESAAAARARAGARAVGGRGQRRLRAGDAGAVARPLVGGVAPQRLHREGLPRVAGDVAERAVDRLRRALRGEQVLAHPGALVTVLVGVERVIPAAVVGLAAGEPGADHVLGPRVGDRLLD